MRYADLSSGGRELAAALERHGGREDVLVIGIVRGGVPAAVEVAVRLDLPLDLLLLRALLQQPSGGFLRAVRIGGNLVADPELLDLPADTPGEVRWFVDDALSALEAREKECRGDRPAVDVEGKTVVLVDCGMRTGGTMRAAIAAVRRAGASAVVAAVPAGAAPACALVAPLADETICLYTPESLANVAVAYQRFDVPAFEQIHALLPKL
jgi:putative phosphoribosyl transferase